MRSKASISATIVVNENLFWFGTSHYANSSSIPFTSALVGAPRRVSITVQQIDEQISVPHLQPLRKSWCRLSGVDVLADAPKIGS